MKVESMIIAADNLTTIKARWLWDVAMVPVLASGPAHDHNQEAPSASVAGLQERRKEFGKTVSKLGEEGKIAIR